MLAAKIIGGVMVWAVWGAVCFRAEMSRDPDKSDLERDRIAFICLIFAPIFGTFTLAEWAIWRLSAEGRHEKRLREMRRRRELEQELDDEIQRLEE